MEYIYTPNNELYHHGVKGMRWGVRRYQNADGSLTPAGKKHRASTEEGKLKEREKQIKAKEREKAKRAKLDAKKAELDAREKALRKSGKTDQKQAEAKTKSISEMSNKELQEHTTRMTLEKNYYDAQKNLASAMPQKQQSMGRKYAEKFLNDAVVPALSNSAKAYLENFMKKKLGLETKDELADLKRTADILDAKLRIDKHKNPDKYKSIDELTKEYDLQVKKDKAAKEKADAEAKAAEDAKKKADDEAAEWRKYEEANEPYTNPKDNTPPYSGYRSGPNNVSRGTTTDASSEGESYVTRLLNAPAKEGTVEGVGNSSRQNTSSKQSSSKSTIIDAEPYALVPITKNTASKINTMASSGKYTYAEIASKLGVSTSTVSNYSKGKEHVDRLMSYDEDGKLIGYWSERMTVDGFI